MGAILGGLMSSASSLIGGMMGQNNQNSINQQNIQLAEEQASGAFLPSYYSNLVSGAKAAGLSPLAVLGQNAGQLGSPVAVGNNDIGKGMADAGQDIGRAATAYLNPSAKADLALKQAQIDNINADTAGKMRRTFAAPGSPPGLPKGSEGNPIPASAYYRGPNGEVFVGPSREYADTQFGPSAWLTGTEQLASQAGRQAWDLGKFGVSAGQDVWRHIQNTQIPDSIAPGGM